jgi:hypothetical protein
MGRPALGLGQRLHGDGGDRDPRLHLRLYLRGGRRAGLRRHHPARHRGPEGEVRSAAPARRPLRRRGAHRATRRVRLLRHRRHRRRPGRPLRPQRPEALHRGRRGGGLFPGLRKDQSRREALRGNHGVHRRPGPGRHRRVPLRPDGLQGRRHRPGGVPRREGPEGECGRQDRRRGGGVQHHDDSRAPRDGRHDHRARPGPWRSPAATPPAARPSAGRSTASRA